MKLGGFELYQLRLPLTVPYKVSSKTIRELTPIVIRVRDTNGAEGWGEAQISKGYTTETIEGGWQFCCERAQRLSSATLDGARCEIEKSVDQHPNAASAMLAALDMLVHDSLLSVESPQNIPLLAPCQAHELAEITDEVEELLIEGFRTLKVKVGFDWADDLSRVFAIQDIVDGRASIRLDANRGFTREEGVAFASRLDPTGIELFEQPCATEDWDSNAAVAASSRVPIMLDESIYSKSDIVRASAIPGVRFVKLKLKKIGSVQALRAALARIRDLGLEPVLGDGVATDLGCWMEACVAAREITNAGEMNGFLKTKDQLFINRIPFSKGCIALEPQFWPTIDLSLIDRATERSMRFGPTVITTLT